MARPFTNAERTLLAGDHNVHAQLEIENGDGGWTDVTAYASGIGTLDFFESARWKRDVDTPVMSGAIVLARRDGIYSLAPGMQGSPLNKKAVGTYSPLCAPSRKVRLRTAVTAVGAARPAAGNAAWKEAFLGKIDDPDAGDANGDTITLAVSDIGAFLAAVWIQEERVYGTDAGVPVETVMQQILDDWPSTRLGPVALYVSVSPGWNIRTYKQQRGSVLEALRTLAQQIGWDVRFMYDAAGTFRLTFYEPARTKSAVDYALGPDEYLTLPQLHEPDTDVRNVIVVKFTDRATGAAGISIATSPESIAAYDARFMEVDQDATSNIDSQSEADAMTAAMLSDLQNPLVEQTVETTYFWPAELGDLVAFEANGEHYDAPQHIGLSSIAWELAADGNGTTTLLGRGNVVGAYKDWLRRQAIGPQDQPDAPTDIFLKNFRETGRDDDAVHYAWDGAENTSQIWLYSRTYAQPVASAPWPVDGDVPTSRLDPATTHTLSVPYPPLGKITYVQLEPRNAALTAGTVVRIRVLPVGAPPTITNLRQENALSGLFAFLTVDVSDPQGKGGVLKAWLNVGKSENANPDEAPDGTRTIAATPTVAGGNQMFDLTGGGTAPIMSNLTVHPGRGKQVYFEFVNTAGVSSGVTQFTLLPGGGIIDADGKLTDGAINDAAQFAATIQPVQVFTSTLPSDAPDGSVAFLVSTGKLYRRTGGTWTAAVQAVDINGQLLSSQIADAAINTAKFAAGLRPVELLASPLPASPVDGRVAFNTTDGKLYRASGGDWTAAVPTVDLTGTINSAQIADAAITAAKIGAAAVQTANIATSAITNALIAAGAVTTTTIADGSISTPKIVAGAITTTELAAGAVTAGTIAAGAITSAQIATGTITAGNMAAHTITAGQIAAGAITATEIASHTITAGQILANAITANELATNSVIAGKIAAGAITSTEIASRAISADRIAVGTLTGNEMAANSISGTRIQARTISANEIAAGTITATELAANSIIAGKIAAGAINTAALIVDGVITSVKMNVGVLSSISSNIGIIVAGKLTGATGSFIDLNATGASAFLQHQSSGGGIALQLLANGNATFGGTVTSDTFTAASIRLANVGGTSGTELRFESWLSLGAAIMWSGGGGTAYLYSNGGGLTGNANGPFTMGSTNFTVNASGKAKVISTADTALLQAATTATVSGNTVELLYTFLSLNGWNVTIGAADSGGSGYRVLRIPNF